MGKVRSSDGTVIAYETRGEGPALILVDGALCSREFGGMPKLAEQLTDHFTVYLYDRRGRGESGDADTYSIDREVDDIQALIDEAGGSAHLYGISSGAALALEAAARCTGVERLATYEAPFIVDESREPIPADYLPTLDAHVAAGRRGKAVKQFMRAVGTPGIFVALMQATPIWKKLKAVAHTLPYDARTVIAHQHGEPLPAGRYADVTAPTLVMDGGKSPEWMRSAQRAIAEAVPNAELRTLEGQTHMVKPKVLAPALVEFLAAARADDGQVGAPGDAALAHA